MHSHWRNCEDWRNEGLRLSTSSNEAAKLFDVATSQYIGLYEDAEFGGVEGTLKAMVDTDPGFVMGYVVHNAVQLMGLSKTPRVDTGLRVSLDHLSRLALNTSGLTHRERQHVKAVLEFADGYIDKACDTWEEILYDHPHDAFALRLLQNSYYFLGANEAMRDSAARVIPLWSPGHPHYGYLLGIHSFGLCETRDFKNALAVAHTALEINPRDSWSTHAVAHVLEMQGEYDKGLSFLNSTVSDWQPASMMACHINWHAAVYHIEKSNYDAAFEIFDDMIMKSLRENENVFGISDGASLLYRLSLEGCDVGVDRWRRLCELSVPHIHDHLSAFYDAHLLMAYLGANSSQHVDEFLQSLTNYIGATHTPNARVSERVGMTLFKALIDYNNDKFESVVEHLMPIKYDITDGSLNGSRAQKDVFMQLLIHSAMRSVNPRHHITARRLLNERRALRPISPLTDRLVYKLDCLDGPGFG